MSNSKASTTAHERVLIKRREAAAMAGWSVVTLARRERSDPNIPVRVSIGPGEYGPFAYRADEWTAYLAQLPRSAPITVTRSSTRYGEGARHALAKRRTRTAAEARSVELGATPSSGKPIAPKDAPLDEAATP